MMRLSFLSCLLLFAVTACAAEERPLMTWPDLTSRPLPQPTRTLRYAEGDSAVVDLWLPPGAGPHPVVVMIHGGCWQKAIADRTLMNYAAEALRLQGVAVWNIEYRGVDEPGGGYPGTFLDVAAAIDLLASEAERHGLVAGPVVAFGHSAGGHLAAWAAARDNLPPTSPLWSDDPTPIRAAIVSGGLADLEASEPVTLPSCLADIRERLTGAPGPVRADPYGDTSPARLQPAPATQISVNAVEDRIAPPLLGAGYTALVLEAGGDAAYIEVPGGHVELIAPGTEAFDRQKALILETLRP